MTEFRLTAALRKHPRPSNRGGGGEEKYSTGTEDRRVACQGDRERIECWDGNAGYMCGENTG